MIPHLLSLIIFTPLVGAALVLFCPPKSARNIALLTSGIVLALSLYGLQVFDPAVAEMQLMEKLPWIPQFNIHYLVGTDGISFPMVLLTALISFVACIGSACIQVRLREYYFLFLLLMTGMMGTFLALDLFLFYIFWELVLVPMYFLIGIWGGPRREYAAIKFFLYTLAGSLFMLLGILALYFKSGTHTFNWLELTQNDFSPAFQKMAFLAFFLGFAIKVPVFPFHTWLPDAHVEAPTPISVILAGVLLKMGTYGFFRFSYPLFPEATAWFTPALTVLALIGIIYGGFVALAQKDFKKLVAYSSVSHMGFVLLGLAAGTLTAYSGAMLQMVSHGLITGGLFLLVGMLYDRTHTRDMKAFGGLGAQMPVYSGFLIFFSLASLGLPGLSGFIAEFLVLLGTYPYSKLVTALACLGIILAATYLLLMIRRVLLGPLNSHWKSITDMNRREVASLLPLMILILAIGIYPNCILPLMTPALQGLLTAMGAK